MTIHSQPHPKAGQTVKIIQGAQHPQVKDFGGSDFRLEDWWDRIGGQSWQHCAGNPACLIYAVRGGMGTLPMDDEVVYGKMGHFGHLVHVSELDNA